jgi:hypothetical protein
MLSLPVGYRFPASAALILAAVPSMAAAQVELSTYVGLFVPASDVACNTFAMPTFPSPIVSDSGALEDTVIVHLRQEMSATVGTRLTVWLSERVGVEAVASYAASQLQAKEAELVGATARVLVRFGLPAERSALHVLAGLGFLHRGGDAYERLQGTTEFRFVVGSGLRVRVSRKLTVRVDIEDNLSKPNLGFRERGWISVDRSPPELDNRLQHDIMISPSLVVTLGGL